MSKYTHRVKVGPTQLEYRYSFGEELIEKYHKDGYLYGYHADGVLLGDLVEINDEYVVFEYWIKHHNEIEEVDE